MYYNSRVLSTSEETYINKAQQRIAQIGGSLADEIERNDATYEDSQISVELQYSIEVLMYPALDWTTEEIQIMIDFYTLRANLYEFAVCSIDTQAIPTFPGTACVSIEMLNTLKEELLIIIEAGDNDLQAQLDQEILDRIAGDQNLQDQIDNIDAGGGTPALLTDLTAQEDVGNIEKGDFFPEGTLLDTMWRKLLDKDTSITNLTYNNYKNPVENGTTLTVTTFSWDSYGSPQNLLLSDDKGIITNQPVTGNQYTPPSPVDYFLGTAETITWTITSPDIKDSILTVTSQYYSLAGSKQLPGSEWNSPVVIIETDLSDAYNGAPNTLKALEFTSNQINFSLVVATGWHGWVAVPNVQTGNVYSKWFVTEDNNGPIVTGDFIAVQQTNLTFNGVPYQVYTWQYSSPLNTPLKLHR